MAFATFELHKINVNFVFEESVHLPYVSKLNSIDTDCKLLHVSALIIAPILTHIFILSLNLGLIVGN